MIELQPLSSKRRLRHLRRDFLWRLRFRTGGKRYGQLVGRATSSKRNPELAVAAAAIGSTYWDWAKTMLTTLREQGNYDGPVYLVTDNPGAFRDAANVVIIRVPKTSHRLVAKSCKLMLRDWVKESVMLYLDADVLVTADIGQWYEKNTSRLRQKPMWCFDDVNPFPGAHHSGVILLDTVAAEPIYQDWMAAIRSGRFQFDQECLALVSEQHEIGRLPGEDLLFLRDAIETETAPPCFVHVTRGMIRKYSEPEIRNYLRNELGVSRIPDIFGRSIQ